MKTPWPTTVELKYATVSPKGHLFERIVSWRLSGDPKEDNMFFDRLIQALEDCAKKDN